MNDPTSKSTPARRREKDVVKTAETAVSSHPVGSGVGVLGGAAAGALAGVAAGPVGSLGGAIAGAALGATAATSSGPVGPSDPVDVRTAQPWDDKWKECFDRGELAEASAPDLDWEDTRRVARYVTNAYLATDHAKRWDEVEAGLQADWWRQSETIKWERVAPLAYRVWQKMRHPELPVHTD